MYSQIAEQVEQRCRFQDSFFHGNKPGILFALKDWDTASATFANDEYVTDILNVQVKQYYQDNGNLPDKATLYQMVEGLISWHRERLKQRGGLKPDNGVPTFQCHTDSGCKVATILDQTPHFMQGMFWHDPQLSYEQFMGLRLNPDSRWLTFLVDIYEALQHYCEGDYLALPYSHRSPLDLANALRGNDIFLEMYTEPDRVKDMINKVVDMELEIEKTIYERVPYSRQKCRTGQWAIALPDKAVWVNGDPVGMISGEMMREFEQPTTGRLFSSTGGGFFHNHTLGLRQAANVCDTPGIYVQQFEKDMNVPTFEETMQNNAKLREEIIQASRKTVITPHSIRIREVETLLPYLKGGRFFLLINNDGDEEDVARAIKAVERHNREEGLN